MFNVNNKDTRTTPVASFWSFYCKLWTYFTPCCNVSAFNFEHVIAGWPAFSFSPLLNEILTPYSFPFSEISSSNKGKGCSNCAFGHSFYSLNSFMRGPYHIETSPLICRANHWTGFYMIETSSVMKELNIMQSDLSLLSIKFSKCQIISPKIHLNCFHC